MLSAQRRQSRPTSDPRREATTIAVAWPVAWLLASLLACGGNTPPSPTDAGAAGAADPSPTRSASAPTADAAPEAATPTPLEDPRILAESGLGVGGELTAFEAVDPRMADAPCEVCRDRDRPTIIAFGHPEDPDFHEDLLNIAALVAKHGETRLTAFGVVATPTAAAPARPLPPGASREAALATAKATAEHLDLTIPLVVPVSPGPGEPTEDDPFTRYNITKTRTILFADARGRVHYSAIAPRELVELHRSILEVLGETTSAPENPPSAAR